LASTPATIAAKGDVLKRFSRAIVMASLFVRYNPAVAARWFIEAGGGGGKLTPLALQNEIAELNQLQGELPATDPENKRIGYFSLTNMQIYSQTLYNYGKTAQVVPAAAVATNDFIPYANDFDHKAVIALAKSMH
jgi:ABC-type nitrate/sulfonate/bicarbonate transport system substrate-binding protein